MKKLLLTVAFISAGTIAFATPHTVDRGDGVHVPNPACDSSCRGEVTPTPATPVETPVKPTAPAETQTPSQTTPVATPVVPTTPSKTNGSRSDNKITRSKGSTVSECRYVYDEWHNRHILITYNGVSSSDNSVWAQEKRANILYNCRERLKNE